MAPVTAEQSRNASGVDRQRMPTFLVIGAQKAGTTSVYHYLDQHPDVFMSPVKEPCFFAFEGQTLDFRGPGNSPAALNSFAVTDLDAYQRLFDGSRPEHARGEASTLYLPVEGSAQRIHTYLPDAKLIVILRNPVDRGYSSYLHARRTGREPEADFGRALELEQSRIDNRWGFIYRYRTLGFYHDQLRPYFELFNRDQILVLRYEELISNASTLMANVFSFIGVDDRFTPDMSTHHNQSGEPRSLRLQTLVEKPSGVAAVVKPIVPRFVRDAVRRQVYRRNLKRPPLPPEIRTRLKGEFADDLRRTSELTNVDLSAWLG